MAFSRVQTFRFDHGDTARYANILSAAYLDTVPAVSLRLEIDPDFHDADYVLITGAVVVIIRGFIRNHEKE